MKVKVFGRHGSDYMKAIKKWLGNHKIAECNLAFNYGLQGKKLQDYHAKYPQLQRLPILNHQQVGNKYDHVALAASAGVKTPSTNRNADGLGQEVTWIQKPYYSLGGRDISVYQHGAPLPKTHYLQEKIENRRYEMRVHAWAWVDPKDWIFQKRVHEDGENVLCWNHHNGGKFITVDNPTDPLHNRLRKDVKKLMKKFGYHFGAADFIIQNPGERGKKLISYFIEWNLAPGWTLERIEVLYKDYFERLQNLTKDDIDLLIEGIMPWEDAYIIDDEGEVIDEEPMPNDGHVFRFYGQEQANPVPEPEQPRMEMEDRYIAELLENKWIRKSLDQLQVNKEHLAMPDIRKIIEEHAAHLEQRDQRNKELLAHAEALRLEREEDEEERALAELDRYNEAQEEAQAEMNFCPECGRPVNRDIFGGLPKFCTSCGRRVR